MKKRVDAGYSAFTKAVKKRDNYTCQMPYCGSKHSLVVHHIRRYANCPHLRTDPNNGITLCRKCHKSIFSKEKRYAPIFLSIIKQNGNKKT